eukprot:gene7500-7710_t
MAVDLTAGTVAGIAQLLVGHPFDTVKVKLQSQSTTAGSAQFKGPLDAAKQTIIKEGIKGIYKGMGAPLAAVAVFNAVLFASRGQMEVLLAHKDGSGLTLSDDLAAAVGASCAVSLVATPTELLKCRLQAQGCSATARLRLLDAGLDPSKVQGSPRLLQLTPLGDVYHYLQWHAAACIGTDGLQHLAEAHTIYRGPRDVARHVVRHEGGVLGLFKGLNATLYRETLGNMAMFGVYELVKQQFVTARVDSYDKPRFRGILDCGRQVVAAEGVHGLFKGFAPALARSFPANAVCFAVYEATKSTLNGLRGA